MASPPSPPARTTALASCSPPLSLTLLPPPSPSQLTPMRPPSPSVRTTRSVPPPRSLPPFPPTPLVATVPLATRLLALAGASLPVPPLLPSPPRPSLSPSPATTARTCKRCSSRGQCLGPLSLDNNEAQWYSRPNAEMVWELYGTHVGHLLYYDGT
ncbi:hypothetical protein BB8028_0004g07500 [Beauveria bassiana]|uniref:Uncharacterized protein n=1 Tax=Beauveria bassiana TaxID=176275 RepID=A0A2S7YCU7_BEABA|nr:hypothetical protein BB8028_0004g07500 [Beauveria bassiana]